ncbi:hypothetical protein DTO280E4_1323 [Paecilomyces variotii]|nr:hypothetical protein DTO166G5_6582 [Paecilomyces variotii]KAJ9254230.1 hypothetical protein DTO195F2_6734 [Paecilomyces variotii]KAJ9364543.1 hypothetical protein DTO280E4_1323 [Paecilomyces variotii]
MIILTKAEDFRPGPAFKKPPSAVFIQSRYHYLCGYYREESGPMPSYPVSAGAVCITDQEKFLNLSHCSGDMLTSDGRMQFVGLR